MFWRYTIWGWLWALLILAGSLVPSSGLPSIHLKYGDKWAHFGIYAVLSFLLIYGFRRQYQFTRWRYYGVVIALLFSFVYGLTLELLQAQLTVSRKAETWDLLANAIGCLSGAFAYYLMPRKFASHADQKAS